MGTVSSASLSRSSIVCSGGRSNSGDASCGIGNRGETSGSRICMSETTSVPSGDARLSRVDNPFSARSHAASACTATRRLRTSIRPTHMRCPFNRRTAHAFANTYLLRTTVLSHGSQWQHARLLDIRRASDTCVWPSRSHPREPCLLPPETSRHRRAASAPEPAIHPWKAWHRKAGFVSASYPRTRAARPPSARAARRIATLQSATQASSARTAATSPRSPPPP